MKKQQVNNKAAIANHLRTNHRQKSPVQKADHHHHHKPELKIKNIPAVRQEFAPIHPDGVDDDKLVYKFPSALAFGIGGNNSYRNTVVRDVLQENTYNRDMSRCTPGGLVNLILRLNNNIYFPTPGMDNYSDLPSFDHPIIFSDSDLDLDFFN